MHYVIAVRTSVDIPDPLMTRVKALAKKRGTSLRQLIIEGLGGLLAAERQGQRGFALRDASVGDGGLVKGLTPGDWETIRARAYEGRGE